VAKDIARNVAQEKAIAMSPSMALGVSVAEPVGPPLIKRALLGSSEFIAKKLVPIATIADFGFTLFKFVKELKGLFKALDELKAAKTFEQDAIERKRARDRGKVMTPAAVIGMGFGGFGVLARGVEDTITNFTLLDKKIDELTKGGNTARLGRRFRKAKSDFFRDFPAPDERVPFRLTPIAEDRKGLRLSPRGFLDRKGEINLLFWRLRVIASRTRQDAGLIANRRIAELRRQGFTVSREERQKIRERTFDRLFKERTQRPISRIRELQKQLRDELDRRGIRTQTSAQQQQAPLVQDIRDSVNEMKASIGSLVAVVEKGIQAIAGTERRIKTAGAQRT